MCGGKVRPESTSERVFDLVIMVGIGTAITLVGFLLPLSDGLTIALKAMFVIGGPIITGGWYRADLREKERTISVWRRIGPFGDGSGAR